MRPTTLTAPRWLAGILALFAVLAPRPGHAGTFGVPTALTAAGARSGSTVNPPGYFQIYGLSSASSTGDTVHQVRLFIEVTGTTLDVEVFDAAGSGALDVASSAANRVTTQYQLLDPAQTSLGTISIRDEIAATDDSLARFPCTGGAFVADNLGTIWGNGGGCAQAINPGLYEFRVTVTSGNAASSQAFGVRIRDAAGIPYNVFVGSDSDTTVTAPGVNESAFLLGAGTPAAVGAPALLYPFVDRGCTVETANYDADAAGTKTLVDTLGVSTTLTAGGSATPQTNTVTVESITAPPNNVDATNYGMYTLTDDISASTDVVDWRVSDYLGSTAQAGFPPRPLRPVRIYLPNAYAPSGGSANGTPPAEPVLATIARVVSGANPPAVGVQTRYLLSSALYNPGPTAINGLKIVIPLATNMTYVAGTEQGTIVDSGGTQTSAATLCNPTGDVSAAGFRACNIGTIPAGGTGSLNIEVTNTPAAPGSVRLTGVPTTGTASTITTISRAGTTLTATTTAVHGYAVNDVVTISGPGDQRYNGTYVIASTPTTTTFTAAGVLGTPATDNTDRSSVVECRSAANGPVCATYTPAVGAGTFARTEQAGPMCQLTVDVPELRVIVTDSPDPVVAGQPLTYAIVVTNTGASTISNVTFTDALPAGTTFVSMAQPPGWTCTTPAVGASGVVQCTAASITAGAGLNFSLAVLVNSSYGNGTLTDTAFVSANPASPGNSSGTAVTTVVSQADMTGSIDPQVTSVSTGAVAPLSYSITVRNDGPSQATSPTLTLTLPATLVRFKSVTPAVGWTCTTPAVNSYGGTVSCTRSALADAASAPFSLQMEYDGTGAAGASVSIVSVVSTASTDPISSNNTATAKINIANPFACPPTPGAGGPLAVVGPMMVNTYYPGTANAAAGATTITVGAATGTTSIAIDDLLLVIQMQDAAIDSTNFGNYGDGAAGDPARGVTNLNNTGVYEYVLATAAKGLGAGTISIKGQGAGNGLLNAYTNAAAGGGQGQRRFQVVRVPQYSTLTFTAGTFGTLTASPWDGFAGGVLAVDVSGTLTLANDPTRTVSTLTRTGQVATATTSVAHGYANGDIVTIAGANEAPFNGTYAVTVTSTTTFVYTIYATPAPYPAAAATGTITAVRPAIDTSGLGFRGGGSRQVAGDTGFSNGDYRTSSTSNPNGSKAEGIAGTPRFTYGALGIVSIARAGTTATATTTRAHGFATGAVVTIAGATVGGYNGSFTLTAAAGTTFSYTVAGGLAVPSGSMTVTGVFNTGVEGYPNGSMGRGAPGNAGGGGNDGDPDSNQENSGGGGGGNGGVGGLGGNSWQSNLPVGGFGGDQLIPRPSIMTMGGGGGAGTRNNTTGLLQASSGGAGGGIIMIRAGGLAGSGRIQSDGAQGISPDNDGGGGGGAGGDVMIVTYGSVAPATIFARGGRGGDAWSTVVAGGTPGERHGPGGGGAGGSVLLSSTGATVDVSGGLNGVTTTLSDAFGSTPGTQGRGATGVTFDDMPGTSSGADCQATSGGSTAADVSVVKTDSGATTVGGTITYSIVVRDNGPDTATNVVATDTLPVTFVSFVSATPTQGSCSFVSPTITCNLGTLVRGASARIDVVTTAIATGNPTNSVSITRTETDPNSANNSASVTTAITSAQTDLAVAISGAPDPVAAGSSVTFSLQVSNLTTVAAAATQMSVPVPSNTTFQSFAAPAGWTCTPPAVGAGPPAAVSCTYTAGPFPSGGGSSFTFVVQANAGTTAGTPIVGSVSVSTTTSETQLSNNSAQATITVGPGVTVLTRATLVGLRVSREGRVEFATGTQHGTRFFNLYATADHAGLTGFVRLNENPIRASRPYSLEPTVYDVRTAPITVRYVLVEEVDMLGRVHRMGPFAVGGKRLQMGLDLVNERLAAAGAVSTSLGGDGMALVRSAPLAGFGRRERVQRSARSAFGAPSVAITPPAGPVSAVRIVTSGTGMVDVSRAQLAAAGMAPSVSPADYVFSHAGRKYAFTAGPDGAVRFAARPLWTRDTSRDVYVLAWAPGAGPATGVPLSIMEEPPVASYARAARHYIYVAGTPQALDPWHWDLLVGDGSTWPYPDGFVPDINRFDLPGLVPRTRAVTVRVAFYTVSPVHHDLTVTLNGATVGNAQADGAGDVIVAGTVPADHVLESGNDLRVTYSSSGQTPDDIGIAYLRHVDLSVVQDPSRVAASLVALEPFDLTFPSFKGKDYLIVTHADFRDQADRIAGYKAAEGRSPVVVDVDRAYDRYSGGIVEANAVAQLIKKAVGWSVGRIRDVLIVGDDTFDHQDVTQTGARVFVPSAVSWDGEFGWVPSENGFADVDGDGSPDVAIGRLPVQTTAEADAVAEKIRTQEAVIAAAGGRQLFVNDDQAPGEGSFLDQASSVQARFPRASKSSADLSAGITAARSALFAGLAQGAALTSYFGHGGPEVWADERLLDVADASSVTSPASVFLTWSCESQFYQYAFGPTVNEALLLNPAGGALAVFGPAGITDNGIHALLYDRVYEELSHPGVTLGEAIRRAKARAIAEFPEAQPAVDGFNLIGDPSLVLGDLGAP